MSNLVSIKVRDGLRRITAEHPGLSAPDSPALRRAEDRLNAAMCDWSDGAAEELDVRRAFREWERELLAANRTQERLFG